MTPPLGGDILPVMSVSIRRIGRQGSSLSLTIPRNLAEVLELRRGDDVVLVVEDGALVVRRFPSDALAKIWPEVPRAKPDETDKTD